MTARKGVFDDVLQETVLATYRKGAKRARAVVSFIEAQPGVPVKAEPAGDFTLPRKATAPWFLPRHTDEAELAKRLRAMSARLADWGYKVSTGPSCGTDSSRNCATTKKLAPCLSYGLKA